MVVLKRTGFVLLGAFLSVDDSEDRKVFGLLCLLLAFHLMEIVCKPFQQHFSFVCSTALTIVQVALLLSEAVIFKSNSISKQEKFKFGIGLIVFIVFSFAVSSVKAINHILVEVLKIRLFEMVGNKKDFPASTVSDTQALEILPRLTGSKIKVTQQIVFQDTTATQAREQIEVS